LGLAIARGFAEANGGVLHVESLPEQGATFVFELPLEDVEQNVGEDQPSGVGAVSERDGR
jgi:two-component system sensor histidine kinase KdpD